MSDSVRVTRASITRAYQVGSKATTRSSPLNPEIEINRWKSLLPKTDPLWMERRETPKKQKKKRAKKKHLLKTSNALTKGAKTDKAESRAVETDTTATDTTNQVRVDNSETDTKVRLDNKIGSAERLVSINDTSDTSDDEKLLNEVNRVTGTKINHAMLAQLRIIFTKDTNDTKYTNQSKVGQKRKTPTAKEQSSNEPTSLFFDETHAGPNVSSAYASTTSEDQLSCEQPSCKVMRTKDSVDVKVDNVVTAVIPTGPSTQLESQEATSQVTLATPPTQSTCTILHQNVSNPTTISVDAIERIPKAQLATVQPAAIQPTTIDTIVKNTNADSSTNTTVPTQFAWNEWNTGQFLQWSDAVLPHAFSDKKLRDAVQYNGFDGAGLELLLFEYNTYRNSKQLPEDQANYRNSLNDILPEKQADGTNASMLDFKTLNQLAECALELPKLSAFF